MADEEEFGFSSGERDVDEFAGGLIAVAPAQHRAGEIAGDGRVEDDDVALPPLKGMDCADFDGISQVGLMDEILKEPDLIAVWSDDADRGADRSGLAQRFFRQRNRDGGVVGVAG